MQLHDTTQEILYGYCACGCGEKTKLAPQTHKQKGWVRGEPMRFIAQHHTLQNRPTEKPNSSGLCMCGCGEKTPIAKVSRTGRGWIKGEPKRFVVGHGHKVNTPTKVFWTNVTPGEPDECWLWQGKREPSGYTRVRIRTSFQFVHRLSWEIHFGPIPKGLWVLHRCDNPPCVNPNHLFLGTAKDNMDDKVNKGRQPRGEKIGTSKLTAEQVLSIRRKYANGMRQTAIAKELEITISTVNRIVHRSSWQNI